MPKTPVVIALGLLLAAILVVPAASANLVVLPETCRTAVTEAATKDVTGPSSTWLRPVTTSCVPDVPKTPTPCSKPQVGIEGSCMTPPSVAFCKGSYGAQVEAGELATGVQCQALPPYGVCPTGSYGVWAGNLEACNSTGTCADRLVSPERCGVDLCVGARRGAVVDGTEYCFEAKFVEGFLAACKPQLEPVTGDDCQDEGDPAPPPVCEDEDNEPGFGGTDVECEYDCRLGDELIIYGESKDDEWGDAAVSGYTACGGAEAHCNPGNMRVCGGASAPTTRAARDAVCRAESDEWFDSEVYVACWTEGVSTLCRLSQELPGCNVDLTATSQVTWSAAIFELCASANPQLAGETIASLLGPIEPASSFVAFTRHDAQGIAMRYGVTETSAALVPYCTSQVLTMR